MFVSVVICTWNRASSLSQTLGGMQRLRVPEDVGWELVVVNNNCTDDTDEVVRRHSGRLPIRLLHEPRQGLSNARNRAIPDARGELILWTDDDILVHQDWVAEYVKAARRWSEASFFGGTIRPRFAAALPAWVRNNFQDLAAVYGIRDLGRDCIRLFSPDESPFGGNMAFRRGVLERFRFDVGLGRNGADRWLGEEEELIARLRGAGCQGVWVGPAVVEHCIPPDGLTRRYLWRQFHDMGRAYVRQHCYPACTTLWGAPRWAYRRLAAAQLTAWCFAPFRGPRWFRAFRKAAVLQGVIDESRVLNRSGATQPDRPDGTRRTAES